MRGFFSLLLPGRGAVGEAELDWIVVDNAQANWERPHLLMDLRTDLRQ